jgi:hypothetical protein
VSGYFGDVQARVLILGIQGIEAHCAYGLKGIPGASAPIYKIFIYERSHEGIVASAGAKDPVNQFIKSGSMSS